MAHNQDRRSVFANSVREATVIIFSILIAFSLDAWWEDFQINRDVRDILHAVHEEMKLNLTNLEVSISHHEQIRAAIDNALSESSTETDHSLAVVGVELFEPSFGALDTLVASGLLGYVNDSELRILLGSFTGFVQDLRERESRAENFRDAARRRIAIMGIPIWRSAGADLGPVYSDVEILNLLTLRNTEERDAIQSARRLENHLGKIVSRLDSWL